MPNYMFDDVRCAASDFEGHIPRKVSSKLYEAHLSALDFGAIGDGEADDTASLQAAIDADHPVVLIPEGRYRITAPLVMRHGQSLVGQHPQRSVITGDFDGFLIEIPEDDSLTSRCTVENIGFDIGRTLALGAVQVTGHLTRIAHCWFWGGHAGAWAIDMINANECVIDQVRMGMPGMPGFFFGNGIRYRNDDPGGNLVNYGDSEIIQPIIRLKNEGTTGILLDGGGGGNLINNVNISRIHVHAPENGPAGHADTIGLHLKNASRNRILGGGFEAIAIGIKEEGTGSTGGLECKSNTFIGVYTINAVIPFADSNPQIANSCIERTFIGSGGNFPSLGATGPGDVIVPMSLWTSAHVSGNPGICLRSFSEGELTVTSDGNRAEQHPDKGVRVDVQSTNPTITPTRENDGARFYVGPGFYSQGSGNNKLRDVTIRPILRIEPVSFAMQQPAEAQVQYAAHGSAYAASLGDSGFYLRERLDGDTTHAWRKVLTSRDGVVNEVVAAVDGKVSPDVGTISGAVTLDRKAGGVQFMTLAGNVTSITFANWPASGTASTLRLVIAQDGTGSRTVTWPASVKWPGGTSPVLSTAANAVDIVDLASRDGGSTFHATIAGTGFS